MVNNTPMANRLHIGLFGKRNSGKSSLINAITHQEVALVSDIPHHYRPGVQGNGSVRARPVCLH